MSYGHIAYNAYFTSCVGKSIHGESLPSWEDQSLEIQKHWEAAASAVLNSYEFKP